MLSWLTVHGKDLIWFCMMLIPFIAILMYPVLKRKGWAKTGPNKFSDTLKRLDPIDPSDPSFEPGWIEHRD